MKILAVYFFYFELTFFLRQFKRMNQFFPRCDYSRLLHPSWEDVFFSSPLKWFSFPPHQRPKIHCFFESLSICYFTFTALHSADKFSNEQQILGLRSLPFFIPFPSAPVLFSRPIHQFWIQENKMEEELLERIIIAENKSFNGTGDYFQGLYATWSVPRYELLFMKYLQNLISNLRNLIS